MTTQIIPQTQTLQQPDIFASLAVAVAPSVRIGTDLPTCPAEINPETTLAELRQIKTHWVNVAEQTGDIKAILLAARELGTQVTDTSWLLTLNTPAGTLTADLNVTGFQSWRDGELARLTVTLNGKPVCKLQRTARRLYDEPLFIPGEWVDEFRQRYAQAERQAIARYQRAIENDRLNLLAELGVEVQ